MIEGLGVEPLEYFTNITKKDQTFDTLDLPLDMFTFD